MMRALQQFYRKNFWSCGKRQLFDLLESERDALAGIVLEEVGRPGGRWTLHRWWKTPRMAYYRRIERVSIDDTERFENVVERYALDFDNLLDRLRLCDSPPLKHFAGNVRDGICYSASWGDRNEYRDISIQNPDLSSRYFQFIQVLKENIWTK